MDGFAFIFLGISAGSAFVFGCSVLEKVVEIIEKRKKGDKNGKSY